MKLENQRGQAVLIVLLSLSVVLVIVLYILSRSVTDISLSTKDDDSQRAFSAAEAGVERALVFGPNSDSDFANSGALINAEVTDFAVGETTLVYPISLKSGESATFWFVSHDPDDGSLVCDAACYKSNEVSFYWGDELTSVTNSPAIEVTVYYATLIGTRPDFSTVKVARATFDPYNDRTILNKFDGATNSLKTVGGENFQFNTSLNLVSKMGIPPNSNTSQTLYATVKMLYNTTVSHKVAIVTNGGTLPSQGSVISSTGRYGDANRKISVYQLYPVIPPVFANAIYSATGITK